jgi:hypothetical protein
LHYCIIISLPSVSTAPGLGVQPRMEVLGDPVIAVG